MERTSTPLRTRFSPALENIRMSPIVSISEEARERAAAFEAAGRTLVRFQRGEIDFPTPAHIVDALREGVAKGLTRYPRSGGEGFFRDAVVARMKRDYGIDDLDAECVVATCGGQEALELVFKLFERGAGFAPTWSCALENFVPHAGIDFETVPLEPDFSVNLDRVEAAVRGRDFFYLNNPHNPTGKVFTREELDAIVEVCTRHGVFVVSDEAYEQIVYDGLEHHTLARVPQENVISVFTFSKTFAMTGWRLGYAITRNRHVARLLRLGNYTQTAGVPAFIQYAGAAALERIEASRAAVDAMRAEFARRRDALCDGLEGLPGVRIERPHGAFYLFPDFGERVPKDLAGPERERWVYEQLMEVGVVTVYGACFGPHFTDHVRISFSATPVEVIEEGVARIREVFG